MEKSFYIAFYHKDKKRVLMNHLLCTLLFSWVCSLPKCFVLCCKETISSSKTSSLRLQKKPKKTFEWQKLVNLLEGNATYVYL